MNNIRTEDMPLVRSFAARGAICDACERKFYFRLLGLDEKQVTPEQRAEANKTLEKAREFIQTAGGNSRPGGEGLLRPCWVSCSHCGSCYRPEK